MTLTRESNVMNTLNDFKVQWSLFKIYLSYKHRQVKLIINLAVDDLRWDIIVTIATLCLVLDGVGAHIWGGDQHGCGISV